MKQSLIRVLVVGCGHMGTSHALAYHRSDDFEIVGLVSRTPDSRNRLSQLLGDAYPTFADYPQALKETTPDAVCISTYPDTHAAYTRLALESGCHVFLEKPLATTLEEGIELIELSHQHQRKLVTGYILQHHPSWTLFTEQARTLGKPLVMRMNLNQQSSGAEWQTHRNIMQSMDPMVDCGVHYVDIMCRMTQARPVRVNAISARLCPDLPPGRSNYGQLQVTFDDGSVGWYEAGWGPMMSQTAFFIKDVIGPRGSISISGASALQSASDDIDAHTKTEALLRHHAELGPDGQFLKKDEIIATDDEPDHDALCYNEQMFFAKAIRQNLDLSEHHASIVYSLQIVLAAEQSAASGQTVAIAPLQLSSVESY